MDGKQKRKSDKRKERKSAHLSVGKQLHSLRDASMQLLMKYVEEQRSLHVMRGGSPSTFKISPRDIPFWGAIFGKGTQVPTFRLYFANSSVSCTASTAMAFTKDFRLDVSLNYSSLTALFEEYRPLRGQFEYSPTQTNSTVGAGAVNTNCVGIIDYVSTSALTTFDEGLAHDTHKVFQVAGVTSIAKRVEWNVKFDFIPDEQWVSTGTVTTVFASLKFYLENDHGLGSAKLGKVFGWADYQFRALA